MTINMEKELKLDQMEANILEIISLEKNMDKGNFNGQMARFIQENSLKIIYITLGLMNEQMEGNMLVNEIKIKWKAKECLHELMEDVI